MRLAGQRVSRGSKNGASRSRVADDAVIYRPAARYSQQATAGCLPCRLIVWIGRSRPRSSDDGAPVQHTAFEPIGVMHRRA